MICTTKKQIWKLIITVNRDLINFSTNVLYTKKPTKMRRGSNFWTAGSGTVQNNSQIFFNNVIKSWNDSKLVPGQVWSYFTFCILNLSYDIYFWTKKNSNKSGSFSKRVWHWISKTLRPQRRRKKIPYGK